jgi:hypothetical protein
MMMLEERGFAQGKKRNVYHMPAFGCSLWKSMSLCILII